MGFRFWRRVKLTPGITLNLSKSGASLSFGKRGGHFTVGPHGKRTTIGIPGTGLFYTTSSKRGSSRRRHKEVKHDENTFFADKQRLDLGFFARLFTPADEEALVDGCKALVIGDETAAMEHFEQSLHLADGAYLAGFLALKQGALEKAVRYLRIAGKHKDQLGHYFNKYGIHAVMSIQITDEVAAFVEPDEKGVLLGLVEAFQHLNHIEQMMEALEKLHRLAPDDLLVKLSFIEIMSHVCVFGDNHSVCKKIVKLTEGINNESAVHAALLLYRGKAFARLGLYTAARQTLTIALRRKKGRSNELLKAIRYERALIYDKLRQHARAQADLERIYSDDPEYEDVAQKLGL